MSTKRFNHSEHGHVEVRTAMFDTNGTDLVEGVEIKFLEDDSCPIIEIYGWLDIEELTTNKVGTLIDENI